MDTIQRIFVVTAIIGFAGFVITLTLLEFMPVLAVRCAAV
jgi:hypothetical protein